MNFEVVTSGYEFVEAPRQAPNGDLYFSDLTGGGLWSWSAKGGARKVLDRRWIGGCVTDRGGDVICSGKGGLVRLNPATGAATPILTRVGGQSVDSINDIEADAQGGLYGGTVDFEAILGRGEAPQPGKFFHLAADGRLTVLRDDVVASNGVDFAPDRSRMYHSESTVGVWTYPLDGQGRAGKGELFAKLDDCDGLAVDAEGGVWVAFWAKAELIRFRPDASVDRQIKLPFPSLVSLTFGGDDLRDLYVSTGGAPADKKGGVIRLRTDIPGQRSNRTQFAADFSEENVHEG